jgi:hypothetical protein
LLGSHVIDIADKARAQSTAIGSRPDELLNGDTGLLKTEPLTRIDATVKKYGNFLMPGKLL